MYAHEFSTNHQQEDLYSKFTQFHLMHRHEFPKDPHPEDLLQTPHSQHTKHLSSLLTATISRIRVSLDHLLQWRKQITIPNNHRKENSKTPLHILEESEINRIDSTTSPISKVSGYVFIPPKRHTESPIQKNLYLQLQYLLHQELQSILQGFPDSPLSKQQENTHHQPPIDPRILTERIMQNAQQYAQYPHTYGCIWNKCNGILAHFIETYEIPFLARENHIPQEKLEAEFAMYLIVPAEKGFPSLQGLEAIQKSLYFMKKTKNTQYIQISEFETH